MLIAVISGPWHRNFAFHVGQRGRVLTSPLSQFFTPAEWQSRSRCEPLPASVNSIGRLLTLCPNTMLTNRVRKLTPSQLT